MKTAFACPSCGVSGSVDEALIGRQIRCNQCNHRFAVPGPASAEADGYALVEPTRGSLGGAESSTASGAVYVPSRGGEPPIALSPRRPKAITSGSNRKKSRGEESGFAWKTWLVGSGSARNSPTWRPP